MRLFLLLLFGYICNAVLLGIAYCKLINSSVFFSFFYDDTFSLFILSSPFVSRIQLKQKADV